MREIEVKVRLTDTQPVLVALKNIGAELGEPTKQHDVVYGQLNLPDHGHGSNWLRVRTENDSKVIFTLKKSVTGELDSIEHEVVIDNAVEMTAIISYLGGYELYSDLTKIRRKAHYGDIELCLDEVPGLGTFLEAEKLCPEDVDYKQVSAELWKLFTQLGLKQDDQETSGYDVLMRLANGQER